MTLGAVKQCVIVTWTLGESIPEQPVQRVASQGNMQAKSAALSIYERGTEMIHLRF